MAFSRDVSLGRLCYHQRFNFLVLTKDKKKKKTKWGGQYFASFWYRWKTELKKKDSVKQGRLCILILIKTCFTGAMKVNESRQTTVTRSSSSILTARRQYNLSLIRLGEDSACALSNINLALDSESCWNSAANFKCLIGLNREIRAATRPLNNLTLESLWLIRLCRDAYNAYKSQLAG